MPTDLTIQVPDDVMERLLVLSDREFRTPEMQVLWLVKAAAEAAERRQAEVVRSEDRIEAGRRSREERLRDAEALFAEIRTLHKFAGEPSSRTIAELISRSGKPVSHTTVNELLQGRKPPSWSVLERTVTALGGDVERFRTIWVQSRG